MALLSRIGVATSYAGHELPALIVVGVGLGMTMVTSMNTATFGVRSRDAGVASATVNAAQQIGGSLGTALLNTIAAGATTSYVASHAPDPLTRVVATVHGYTVASWWAAGILAGAGLLAGLLVNAPRLADDPHAAGPVDAPQPAASAV